MGLGLWQNMPAGLAVEAAIVLAGLWLFLCGASMTRARRTWLAIVALLILAFTVVGMTVAPPAPSVMAMAASSLGTNLVLCALAFWIGWLPEKRGAPS